MRVKHIKKSGNNIVVGSKVLDNFRVSSLTASNISINSEIFFKMLVDLSIADGLSCGECSGFQCSRCWRGVAVCYAMRNSQFFEWLHKNKGMLGVDDILNGLSFIVENKGGGENETWEK